MIITPRSREVIDILLKNGNDFIPIDEVFLYEPSKIETPFRSKILYWKRTQPSKGALPDGDWDYGKDTEEDKETISLPEINRFAIVPEMVANKTLEFSVTGNEYYKDNSKPAWHAFDRRTYTNTSIDHAAFEQPTWIEISFPTQRLVQGFSLQFEEYAETLWIAVEGRSRSTSNWINIYENTITPVNQGYFDAVHRPTWCSSVRILFFRKMKIQSCQIYTCYSLIPITMISNSAPEVLLEGWERQNNLFSLFALQNKPYNIGSAIRHYGLEIKFNTNLVIPHLHGFVIGGISNYDEHTCYVNRFNLLGRYDNSMEWKTIKQVEFKPFEQKTIYIDLDDAVNFPFLCIRTTSRTTDNVNDDTPLYLAPIQFYGMLENVEHDIKLPSPYDGYGVPPSPYNAFSAPIAQQSSSIYTETDSDSLVLALTRENNNGDNYV